MGVGDRRDVDLVEVRETLNFKNSSTVQAIQGYVFYTKTKSTQNLT